MIKTGLFEFTEKSDIHPIWEVMGVLLSIFTLGLVFWLCYEWFFERALYLNRKKLIKYLEQYDVNDLSLVAFHDVEDGNEGKTLKKRLKLSDGAIIYQWSDHGICLFYKNDMYVHGFAGSLLGRRQSEKLRKLVESV